MDCEDVAAGGCAEALNKVQSLLDEELDAVTAQRLLRHLEACDPCGREGEIYRELKATVSACGNGIDRATVERLRRFATQLVAGG